MRGREWIFGPTTRCRRARTLGSAPTPLEIQSDANKWIGLAMLHADINTSLYALTWTVWCEVHTTNAILKMVLRATLDFDIFQPPSKPFIRWTGAQNSRPAKKGYRTHTRGGDDFIVFLSVSRSHRTPHRSLITHAQCRPLNLSNH